MAYTCPECGKELKDFSALQEHTEQKHSGDLAGGLAEAPEAPDFTTAPGPSGGQGASPAEAPPPPPKPISGSVSDDPVFRPGGAGHPGGEPPAGEDSAKPRYGSDASGEKEGPAAPPQRRRRSPLRAILLGFLGVIVLLGVIGALVGEPETVDPTPGSPAAQIAQELRQAGDVSEFRPVEPDEGWDVQYELDGGDGEVRSRGAGNQIEVEYRGESDELESAIQRAAGRVSQRNARGS